MSAIEFQNNLWQSAKWEHFQNACGNETFRVQDVLIIERQTAFGKNFFEIPRVQIGNMSEQFWNELDQKAREKKAVFTRVFPGDKSQELAFKRKVYTKGIPEIFPEHTLVVDLNQSEEEILAQMKQKGRYNIKLSREKGVQVFESNEVSAFYDLLQETTQRDGFSSHSEEVYQNMLESFGDDGVLLLAQYEDQIIAGGIFLISGDTMTYYYGASSNEHRNVMAPYLVQFTAMQMAKERGCSWYDFLGIAPENSSSHRLSGVSSFKEKFGGMRIMYTPAFEIVHQKSWYMLFKVLKNISSFRRSFASLWGRND